MKTIEQKYDDGLKIKLASILKREPSDSELLNSENDTDLTQQVIWDLLVDIDQRLKKLENKV